MLEHVASHDHVHHLPYRAAGVATDAVIRHHVGHLGPATATEYGSLKPPPTVYLPCDYASFAVWRELAQNFISSLLLALATPVYHGARVVRVVPVVAELVVANVVQILGVEAWISESTGGAF